VSSRIRSARVDFPWSMWAIIEKFLIRSMRSALPRGRDHGRERPAGS
jgi:hypothetical protein